VDFYVWSICESWDRCRRIHRAISTLFHKVSVAFDVVDVLLGQVGRPSLAIVEQNYEEHLDHYRGSKVPEKLS